MKPEGKESEKKDAKEIEKNSYDELMTLRRHSNNLKDKNADIIFWPEQSTPWPVNTDETMKKWVEDGAKFLNTPIIGGVLWKESSNESEGKDDEYFNAAAVIDPSLGLQTPAYKKRRLVPFGEYIPFAKEKWMSWLHSFTPVVDSFASGKEPVILSSKIKGQEVKFWPLICSEDTQPFLSDGARTADVMVVFLNDAWFGDAALPQHAAHSVLRSVEQGRPLVRVANNGLSGVIWPEGRGFYLGDVPRARSEVLEVPLTPVETLYSHTEIFWRVLFFILAAGVFISRIIIKQRKS